MVYDLTGGAETTGPPQTNTDPVGNTPVDVLHSAARAGTTPVLDTLVGGILPHVHIKNVLIEDATEDKDGGPAKYKISVQMELYQRKDELLTKSWLNDIDLDLTDGPETITSMFDFFRLNIITVQSRKYVYMMRKSNPLPNPGDEKWDDDKSIFLHKALSADRDPWSDPKAFAGGKAGSLNKHTAMPLPSVFPALRNPDTAHKEGIREEVHNGHVYYAIPLTHEFYWRDSSVSVNRNLGIAAYTSLDLATHLASINPLAEEYADQLNMEGPISAEVIIKGGKIVDTREVFVNLQGRPWTGPVHYHGPNNPVPGDNYQGYMTGEFHSPDLENEKLEVATWPNTLVQDFTDPLDQKIPDLFGEPSPDAVSNIGPNYKKIEKELGVILSPLQKEAKKDFAKDNDTEYSKLYISRDSQGAVHGMFYIDIYSLLKNNSQLFPYLSDLAHINYNTVSEILESSRIIELSLKRTRVNSTHGIDGYEKFENDKVHEEPIRTVACIQDVVWGTAESTYNNVGDLREKHFVLSPSTNAVDYTRYFVFSDYNMVAQAVGSYQYQVELNFLDGTQYWLQQKLQKYMKLKVELEAYYKLSTSNAKLPPATIISTFGNRSTETVKNIFKPYYDSRYKRFRSEFFAAAGAIPFTTSSGVGIWKRAADAMKEYRLTFRSGAPTAWTADSLGMKFEKLMLPGPEVSGSPKGILICLNILGRMCASLEKIIGGTKKKKSNNSNELQEVSKNDDLQQLPMQNYETSGFTVKSVIKEEHTWDHPNEIFRAVANKSVYIDYLSLNSEMLSKWSGKDDLFTVSGHVPGRPPVQRIDVKYFKDRCRADVAKYSSYASSTESEALLRGESTSMQPKDGGVISPFSAIERDGVAFGGARMNLPDGTPDTLSRQMYSYLTPSVIELADPTDSDPAWSLRYRAFNPNISSLLFAATMGDDSQVYSNDFFDPDIHEGTWVGLANYVKNRNNFGHADLSEPYDLSHKLPSPFRALIRKREAYKSYFSKYNITIHQEGVHYGEFFGKDGDKPPGAQGHPPNSGNPGKKLPKSTEGDSSDGWMLSSDVFAPLAAGSNLKSVLDLPYGSTWPYIPTTDSSSRWFALPNVYKMARLWSNFSSVGENLKFVPAPMKAILESPAGEHSAIKFFNFNMVAKIEKLIGYGGGVLGSLAVNDKWGLLTEKDLGTGNLFCRISFYDKRLVGHIDSIPILNKYFILTDTVEDYPPPNVPESLSQVSLEDFNSQFFENLNQNKYTDTGMPGGGS